MATPNPWLGHDIPTITAAVARARATRRTVGMVDGIDIDALTAILYGHSGRAVVAPITVAEYFERQAAEFAKRS